MGSLASVRKSQRGVGIVPILIVIAIIAVAAIVFITKGKDKAADGKSATKAAAVSSAVKAGKPISKDAMAEVLPAQTLAFYGAKDFERTWTSFKNSNFWQKFSALPFWKEADFEVTLDNFKKDLEQGLGFEITEDRIIELIGQEFGVAVVPPASADDQIPQVFFLLRTSMKAKIVDSISRLVDANKENQGLAKSSYSDVDIMLIKPENPDDPEVRYFFIGDYLVFGVGNTEVTIKEIIDIASGGKKESLSADKNYSDMISLLSVDGSMIGSFFIDMEKIVKAIGSFEAAQNVDQDVTDSLGALRMIGGVITCDNDLKAKVMVVPNRDKMPAEIAPMWDVKPGVMASLSFIPAGSVIVSASNSLDIGNVWDMWKKNLTGPNANEQTEVIAAALQSLETDYGINVEKDIVSWIGNEVGFVVNNVDTTGMFPVPRLSLVVKVKDQAKAEAFFKKLVELINKNLEESAGGMTLSVQEKNYGGTAVKFFQMPVMVAGLMPGYAFVDDFLVITSNTDVIEGMIDVAKGDKQGVTKDAAFEVLSDAIPAKTNQVAYMNTGIFLDEVVKVLRWVINFQAAQGGEGEANPQMDMLEQQVIPAVDAFKAVESIGMSTVYSENGIEQNIKIAIDDK